jgi:hypothetical protein
MKKKRFIRGDNLSRKKKNTMIEEIHQEKFIINLNERTD